MGSRVDGDCSNFSPPRRWTCDGGVEIIAPVLHATPATPSAHRDFLFVQSTTEVGGAETVLLNLFETSEELRRRSLIATLGFGNGDLPERLRSAGAEVVELKMARLRHPWKLASTFHAL